MADAKKEKAINELFNEKERSSWEHRKKSGGKKVVLIGLLVASSITFPVLLFKDQICHYIAEKDIPVISQYFKVEDIVEVEEELTPEQLQLKVNELQKENADLKKKVTSLTEETKNLTATIDRLKPYENAAESFKKQKEAWDISVAYEVPEMFIEQFKTFYPEMANQVYQELMVKQALTEKEEEYLKIIKSVEAKKAAQLVQSLLKEDKELLLNILNRVGSSKLTEIVSNVDANTSSTIMQLLNPFIETQNNMN